VTISVPFDQRLARLVVRPLAQTPVTPNFLTLLSMAVGLTAAYMMAQGEAVLTNWGAGLFMLAVWMDHLDGELARLTGRTSEFGHYFDHVAAMTNYVAFFIGAGIGLRNGALGDWAVPAGMAAGIAIAAIFSVRLWVELRDGRSAIKQTVRGGFEIEDTLYVIGPVTWLGGLAPFTAAAGVGAPLFLLWVVWLAVRESTSNSDESEVE
jgi:phosphatidylglycerophosphate synthase